MASKAYLTLISLATYMEAVTVSLCKTDPGKLGQTPMPYHQVEAHFHKPLE